MNQEGHLDRSIIPAIRGKVVKRLVLVLENFSAKKIAVFKTRILSSCEVT